MRVEQFNSYILLLPSIYDSPKVMEHTKPAEPFYKSVLACMLLTMCLQAWQVQYNMTQTMLPQDMRWLLAVLENIENMVFMNSNVPTKAPNTNGNNANRKSEKNRKPSVEKHCTLCQKHGGAQATHNTSECTKYEKDGALKSSWGKKSTAKPNGKTKNANGNSFSQVMDCLSKMEKAFKKSSSQLLTRRRRVATVVVAVLIPNRKLGRVVRGTYV
jgi:hypothetical protein